MKKILLSLAALLASLNLYAQGGTVAWGNTSASLITYGEGPNAGAGISGTGAFRIGLFYDNVAGAAADALGQYQTTVLNAAVAGRFFGGTATLTDIPAGSPGTFQVRAWSAAFASFDLANQSPGAWVGRSGIVTLNTGGAGDPAGPAAVLFGSAANQLQGFQMFQVVPEPSTVALGILGLGSLLFLRRRK